MTTSAVPLLKGSVFAEALRRICHTPVTATPLADLKHDRILIPNLIGGETNYAQMGLIGQALRLRGAEVLAISCDALLPACTLQKSDHQQRACDRWCYKNNPEFAEALNLPHRWYSELISSDEIAECYAAADTASVGELTNTTFRGIELGDLIRRSIESHFKLGSIDLAQPAHELQGRRLLAAARMLVIVAERVLDEFRPSKVFLDDGGKIDWGVFRAVARQRGLPVDVVWWGLRKLSIRFERDRPGQFGLRMPEWERWQHEPLTPAQDAALDAYLAHRERVPYEHRPHWTAATPTRAELLEQLGLPARRSGRLFGLFPNVGFDAGRTQHGSLFDNIHEWLLATIDAFRQYPEHDLVIKPHPAEYYLRSGDSLLALIERHFAKLPANVRVVSPDCGFSAGSLARLCDAALLFTSTVGVETAVRGVPVVFAGGGWNASRGISVDVPARAAYFALLERMCTAGYRPPVDVERARRYAYAFFFRSNLEVNFYDCHDNDISQLRVESLAELLPGCDPHLDAICDVILRDRACEAPATVESE